jgi:hypothetical protein
VGFLLLDLQFYVYALLVPLSFFFWPLCCLSCFDLRIMITILVSSSSSQ